MDEATKMIHQLYGERAVEVLEHRWKIIKLSDLPRA